MEIRVPPPVVRPDWDPTWGRDPRDPSLEDRETRTRLLDGWPGKGILAINLEVGDELGQLYLNTQFEALPDQHNDCQRGQNRALADGAEWLKEILELISADDAEWVVSILSRPCPSSGIAPDVEAARRVLGGPQHGPDTGPDSGPVHGSDVRTDV